MSEKKKGLFSNLFKPNACGCGVSIIEENETTNKSTNEKHEQNSQNNNQNQ